MVCQGVEAKGSRHEVTMVIPARGRPVKGSMAADLSGSERTGPRPAGVAEMAGDDSLATHRYAVGADLHLAVYD